MNYKCVIEYDGTDFCGWQFQPNVRTVQGEFEKAIRKMTRSKIGVTAAGRTDSGVHAAGQVVNFQIDRDWAPVIVLKGLNSHLPDDILIKSVVVAPEDFNSRFDAVSRKYRYRLYNGRSAVRRNHFWCTDTSFEYSVVRSLSRKIMGNHDFASFCVQKSQKESNDCKVTKSCWTKHGKEYTFTIVANRFLHGMVRSLVGTMVKVAAGQLSEREFGELVSSPKRSSKVTTAPPQGLTLVKVDYK